MSVSFDPATNRQYGVSYDANGNLMRMSRHTTWRIGW